MPDRFTDHLDGLCRIEFFKQFLAANDDFPQEAKQLSFGDAKPDTYIEGKWRLHALMDELKRVLQITHTNYALSAV
jgi:hypothetical protein